MMRISKTLFKNLTRCKRYASLDETYLKKLDGMVDLEEIDRIERLEELLNQMFDEDSGDDLIDIQDAQLMAMQSYFTELEIISGEKLEKIYGKPIQYALETKDQKKFSYEDDQHEYYCYLDGYLEDENEVCVFEVKATSAKKFIELGKKTSDEGDLMYRYDGIFAYEKPGILRLREEIPRYRDVEKVFPKGKYFQHKNKLYDRFSATGKYAFDISIERYIIEHSLLEQGRPELIDKIKFYLVVLNPDYVFDGEYINGKPNYKPDKTGRELFILLDMTSITKDWMSYIHQMKEIVAENIKAMSSNKVNVGKHCEHKGTSKCKYIPICWKDFLVSGSILEYRRARYAFKHPIDGYLDRFDLLNDGITKIDQIDESLLSKKANQIQRHCYVTKETYVNKNKIVDAIKELRYPIYHLDFESFPCPLPRYAGERPYTQSVFQFSLHVEASKGVCDKDLNHLEYCAPDHADHREELIQKMIECIDLSNGGTVLVYNASFERTRLKEMAAIFPKYKNQLNLIRDSVFDLLYLVDTNKELYTLLGYDEEEASTMNYYDNRLKGSFSIKKVLPIFSELTYETLEIANGTDAILTYANFPEMTKKEFVEKYAALIEYCKQDTWAMVEVLWGLEELTK
jgi:hypothetical protein